ncbi:MAG: hypothetical protein H0T70_03795 [Acidimicrobiia bacterium]|nr:hypothetical protein [Acidimicrobiia bacterium]
MTRTFRVLAFFPCDHAEVVNGKLYMHGGFWGRLNFPLFPHVLPAMSLVAVIEVPFSAYHAEHSLALGIEDADGNALPLHVDATFRVGADAQMQYGDPTVMPLAVPVYSLAIPAPGGYSFTLTVNGDLLERYAIRAYHVAVPMQMNPPPPPLEQG